MGQGVGTAAEAKAAHPEEAGDHAQNQLLNLNKLSLYKVKESNSGMSSYEADSLLHRAYPLSGAGPKMPRRNLFR